MTSKIGRGSVPASFRAPTMICLVAEGLCPRHIPPSNLRPASQANVRSLRYGHQLEVVRGLSHDIHDASNQLNKLIRYQAAGWVSGPGRDIPRVLA